MSSERVIEVNGLRATWSDADTYQVVDMPAATVERRGGGWAICADAQALVSGFRTLFAALRWLGSLVGAEENVASERSASSGPGQ